MRSQTLAIGTLLLLMMSLSLALPPPALAGLSSAYMSADLYTVKKNERITIYAKVWLQPGNADPLPYKVTVQMTLSPSKGVAGSATCSSWTYRYTSSAYADWVYCQWNVTPWKDKGWFGSTVTYKVKIVEINQQNGRVRTLNPYPSVTITLAK
jgi:hypothetical protein